MPTTDVGLDDTLQDNEVGIDVPQSVPMPPGAGAATMPTMTPASAPLPGAGPGGGAMDSMITDYLIKKFGGGGVQGANAPPPMPPPPASVPLDIPVPRSGSANAAPSGPPIAPTLTPQPPQGAPSQSAPSQSAPPQQAPVGSSWGDIIKTVMAKSPREWLESGAATGAAPTSGSANAAPVGPPIPPSANVPLPRPRPGSAPPPPPTTGSANAAYVGRSDRGNPYGSMMPSYTPASMQPAEDVNRPAYGGKSALSGILTGTSPYATPAEAASKPDSVLDKVLNYVKNRTASGSANAASGAKETTGDELATRRQGEKVGPPNTQDYKAKDSGRYSRPYSKGGIKAGQKRPQPKQARAQAPRGSQPQSAQRSQQQMQTKRASAAPQTARGGRSAYAQSLIDSMGPRGQGMTTYIEPATGNEILTGNGIYQNLGKTSTGTQKPSFTKFFS